MLATNDQILFTLNWFKQRHEKLSNVFMDKPYPKSTAGDQEFQAFLAHQCYTSLENKYSK